MKIPMNVHPGEILREEYLEPLGLSAYRLAKEIDVPQTRIGEIINEKRGISADTALRLGKYFKVEAQFWMNLQNIYDLRKAALDAGESITSIEAFKKPLVPSKVTT